MRYLIVTLPIPSKYLSPNWHPATMRGRMAQARLAKQQKLHVQNEVTLLHWPACKRIRVCAIFFHKTRRRRDADNAMGSLKSAYDGIVQAGLVPDDTPKYMEKAVPEFQVDREYPRVELRIIPLQ